MTFSRAREIVEQRHDLERARDALGGDPVRTETGDILAIEPDRTAARLHAAGKHVEERGLARAVRPHQAMEFALGYRKVDALEHDAVAEPDMNACNLDQRHRPPPNNSRIAELPCCRSMSELF